MKFKQLFLFAFVLCSLWVSPTQAHAYTFTSNLSLGSRGTAVVELQKYLNAQGFVISPTGAGSPGKESSIFGARTKQALAKFQKANNISPSIGVFGRLTRSFINNGSVEKSSGKTYSVGGMITGITGPVTLANGSDTLLILPGQSAQFTFAKKLALNQPYSVTVTKTTGDDKCFTPPNQTNSGVVGVADITSIVIQCTKEVGSNPFVARVGGGSVPNYSLGGVVTGLLGNSVVLQTNTGQSLTVTENGAFSFANQIASGTSYSVTVATQPTDPDALCTVTNGSGTISSTVTNISVACVATGDPEASISITSPSVSEGSGPLSYTVTLSHPVSSATTVNYSVSGTATSGTDFTTITSSIVIPADTTTGTITVSSIEDSSIEDNETVGITVRSGTGYSRVDGPLLATGTITNDDSQSENVVYYKQEDGLMLQSPNGSDYFVATAPYVIMNPLETPLDVIFEGDFVFTSANEYFIVDGSNIRIGKQTTNADGSPTVFTINDVINYGGLVSHTGDYPNVSIMNVFVEASGSTTLAINGGWVLRSAGTTTTIYNAGSSGAISQNGGGIVGASSYQVVVHGSYSTGSIGQSAGGIMGRNAESATVNNSFSTGSIGFNAGGIIGQRSEDSTVTNSFSTGAIGAVDKYNAGGIFGGSAGYLGTTCTATNVHSTGAIYGDPSGGNGGIVGGDSENCTITNAYSTGNIGENSGGIVGQYTQNTSVVNAYSTGTIGEYAGGIFGDSAINSTATKTFSIGLPAATAGGIFGSNSDSSVVENSYILQGSAFGENANSATVSSSVIGDSGIWSDAQASMVLGSVSWISPAVNTPYVFLSMQPSMSTPYSTVRVSNDNDGNLSLRSTFTQTIEKGGATLPVLSQYDTCSIVSINESLPSGFPHISINATTGSISTTSSVVAGTYTILVRCEDASNLPITSIVSLIVNE